MKLIYKNEYGASYLLNSSLILNCEIQLVITSVGFFISKKDLKKLLAVVQKSYEPCNCVDCGGKVCTKIWQTNEFVDVCLKVDENILNLLEDLIKGTLFMINLDETLDKYRLKKEE